MTVLLGHTGNGAAKAAWPLCDVDTESCWRWCCRVMVVTALPRRLGHGTI
jgi:hypothetical protein